MDVLADRTSSTPDASLSRPALTGPEERARVIVEWNRTERPYPRGVCVHELFGAQVREHPGAMALAWGEESLTYRELDARANRLAHHLMRLGVGPESRVGVLLERSAELIVSILAVLKAGGAYVPLDPGYPPERLRLMLSDSSVRVLLSRGDLAGAVEAGDLEVVHLDQAADALASESVEAPRSGATAENLAYIVYTSGSTGKPKGVMVAHRHVVQLVVETDYVQIHPGDRVAQASNASFDALTFEAWGAFLNGATLVGVSRDVLLSPPALREMLREERITTLYQTTALLNQLAREQPDVFAPLRDVLFGGQAADADSVRRLLKVGGPERLLHMYGPTETTAWCSWEQVAHVAEDALTVSVGRPTGNQRIYLLDIALNPVPVGAPGEAYVGGDGVVRGYLDRPGLTAERFLPDPFAVEPGARMYRTGDRLRWKADGRLEFIGRVDEQLKVRGFRIEPGEIEATLTAHADVQEARVIVREDEPGEQRLVAYVVGEADAEALREHLRLSLPEYMVPGAFVALERIPLTPNGKLDRKALPAPEGDAYARRNYEAPLGEVEAALAEIWAEVLGVERVGRRDQFFELGGHSLLAIRLIERMRRVGLYTDVRALFTTPALAELALAVDRVSSEVEVPANGIPEGCEFLTPEMLPLVELSQAEIDRIVAEVPGGAANVQDIYPLAPLQEGIHFHHLLSREGDPYLLSTVTEFDTRARLEQYLAALQAVIDRHDVLRTAMAWEGLREPVQVVWRQAPLPVEEVELDAEAGDAAGQLWRRYDPRHYRMDLKRAPLRRACIAEDRASGRWLLLILSHHSTSDHESGEVLEEEISAHLQGRASELPAPLPFRNYVARAHLGVSREEHERFFRAMLGDVEEPTAPYGLLDVRGEGHGIGEAWLPVAGNLGARLRRRARALGVSAASLCHLAWAQVLARLSGRQDVVFGTVLFGRMQGGEGADRVMGPFINTLPVRIGVGEEGVEAAVRRTHALLAELLRHEHASLALAQRCSGVAAPAPLFTSLLNYRYSGGRGRSQEAGQPKEGVRGIGFQERTNYPVGLSVDDLGEEFSLTAQVAAPADAERVCRMMHTALERLVEALEVAPGRAIGSIDVLPEAEHRVVVEEWNRTEAEYPTGACIHELFEEQAARTPDAVAVAFQGETLSYGALNKRANQLAHHLAGLGVRTETRVGICLERGPEMVVSVLAVLKAGGAYVPLDPAYPAERLAFMLADAAVPVLVTQESLRATHFAGDGVAVVSVDGDRGSIAAQSAQNPERGVSPGHLAYVIYTSGSTGTPKGVMVQHGSVTNLLPATRGAFGVGEGDVMPVLASYAFDIWLFEALLPLTSGGAVRLVERERVLDVPALLEEIADATLVHAVPALMRQLVQAERETPRLARLRRAFVGGDRVPADLLAEMQEALPGAESHVLYGPTEGTILASTHPVPEDGIVEGHSIGRPLGNVRLYVCDALGSPQPAGVPGELLIGGAGVARGYLGRSAMTAERFVPDPFSVEGGARLYRTGDRARWRADGTLEFLGRLDGQVKVRGFRIEPGEIEAVLRRHDRVAECVVVAREDEPGERRLAAYVVPAPRKDIELWPSIGEYFVYDELIYHGLTHDTLRNERYLRALQRHAPGKAVLDVGTGADAILARLAVEAGARHVYAVELLEKSYLSARERVRELGLEDRITVIHGDARAVELPEPAEVCVSEIVEAIAGGEGAAVILNQARRLLAPGAVMIPGWVRTRVAAVTLPDEIRHAPAFSPTAAHYVKGIFGEVGYPFDLRLCIRSFPADHVLSTVGTYEELDFGAGPVDAEYVRREELVVERAGRMDGLLLWLRMELAEGEELDTLEEETAWFPVYFPLFEPGIEVAVGDRLRLECWAEIPNGVAPDYGVRGVLVRGRDGEVLPFEFVSYHHRRVFRASPFYRRLFTNGEVPPLPEQRETLPASLREHVQRSLPEYMVPAAFVVLERLPLTPNGKLDRKALPAPEGDAYARRSYEAPLGEVEAALAGIWAEVLGVGRVGRWDHFFALGGHSLLAIRLIGRMRRAGLHADVQALFTTPVLAELALAVGGASPEMEVPANGIPEGCRSITPEMLPLVEVSQAEIDRIVAGVPGGAANVQDVYPLAPLQEGILFHHLLSQEGDPYLLSSVTEFDTRARLEQYLAALQAVIDRHDTLRTAVAWEGLREAVQVVWRQAPLPVEEVELDAGTEKDAAEELWGRYDPRRYRMDVGRAPLLRACIAEDRVRGRWLLLMLSHHLTSDHESLEVQQEEISAHLQGRESELPAPLPFRNYVAQARLGVSREEHEQFFRDLLGDVEEPTAPYGLLDVRGEGHGIGEAWLPVAGDLGARLRRRARALGVSAASLCHLAWAQVLARLSGRADVVFGTLLFGRMQGGEGTDRVMGPFINTLPVRIGVGEEGAEAAVRRTHALLAELLRHEHASLALAQRCSGVAAPAPLFTSLLNYRYVGGRGHSHEAGQPGEGGRSIRTQERTNYPVALSVDDLGEAFSLTAQVAAPADAEQVCRMMHTALERLVEALEVAPGRAIGNIDVLPEAERALVLEEWNRTAAEVPADRCIHELFEAQAARTPGAVAVRVEEESLTYRELDARANRLAHHLRRRGVGPEVRVGVLVERSPALVAAVLGVLKAGGAYVPLDPAYPAERLRYVLEDSGARVLVTGGGVEVALAGGEVDSFAVVDLDAEAEAIAGEPETPPASGVHPQNLAYVIHTSGSTGRPKGTGVPHHSLVSSTRARTAWYGADPERFLLLSSIAFDSSVAGVFWTLCGGGALHLMRGQAHAEPAEVVRRTGEQGITDLLCVPSYYAALLRFVEGPLPSLARAIVAGEAATWELAAQHGALLPHTELVNEYGPTEATVWSTAYRCPPDTAAAGAAVIPIGGPIPNARTYVVDGYGRPVPIGVVGELWVGGAGVTRGYLGRPGMTAERFVPDPFSGEAGARLYRTGDRVRWRADGAIEYLGRLDFQVKVRGFRIELGEIEAVLRQHESVADCAVMARAETGETRLVAYIVGEAEPEALRAHIRRRLPEYMMPAAFVALERLPLTPSGKLDRRALPAPELASPEGAYVAPRTPTEEVLAGIWAEVLRLERVGVEESFFNLGGHSLLATRVVSRVRAVFGVELPLRALFEGPTVAEMARRVEDERRRGLPVLPPVVPVERTAALPLSFAQERLWFLDRLEPESPFYNVPVVWRLGGVLDALALERALGEIVRRHEALRTTFGELDGSPVQVISPFGGFTLAVEDLSALSEADREASVRRRAGEDARQAFDLAAGPLFRAALLRLGEEDHALLLAMHHIVSDEWSLGVLFRELSALYEAYREGRESPLPELAVQFTDYAVWQREQLEGDALDRQLSYWRERLAAAPELLELPTDRPRPPVQTYRGAMVSVDLPLDLLERLQALGRSEGATLYMTLLGAFQVLLSKYGAGEDVVVGSPIAGRTRGEVEELIGFFINTLVLRTDLSGDPSFREVLRRVREVMLGAYENQEVPFEKLVAELQPERSLSHSPLFQVMFTLQNAGDGGGALAGLSVGGVDADVDIAKFDLSLTLSATAAGLRGALNYNTALFERGTVDRMLGHLARVMEQVAADADASLSRLALTGPEERARIVVEWNRTGRAYPRGVCVHELFEAQVRERPGAVALAWGDVELTYRELDARANRLANHLVRLGVGPDARVGVLLERSAELIVSILAVLKAGGAYVTLDPGYPPERLRLMLADSSVRVLLTRGDLASLVPGSHLDVVHLDQVADALASESAEAPHSGATSENLAYIVYTSGSTGRPKGVMVAHRHVVQLVVDTDYVRFQPGDRIAQASNASFDALTFEAWGAFLGGATLVGIPRDVLLSPPALYWMLREERITTLYQTTALLNQLSRELPDVFAPLRDVLFGGQAVDANSVRRLLKAGGPERLLHMYGPTETTAWCSWEQVTHVAEDALTVSVGRPTGNQRIYLLDSALTPVPVGVPGEAYVGGDGVVRGYLERPGLTAERFVPDPFSVEPGARMYRTGDRMRRRTQGALEFMGRLDEQVKIRGFRIEPGEVESALAAHPGVREVRVVVREDEPGEKRLVAYVVGDVEAGVLREHLRRELPEYMVPAAFVPLERLPLTPSGKLDRKALPAPDVASAERRYVTPRTPTEEVLAGIWAEVLGVERVGVKESFFDLGGHSLLAARVVSRVRQVFGVEVPLRALFEGPTIAELAGRVEEIRRAELPVLPPVVPTGRTGALPLSFAQARLWFIDQLEPGSAAYNIPVPLRLRGPVDAGALSGALTELSRRHESLRTVFRASEGEPAQVVLPAGPIALPVVDLRVLPPEAREIETTRLAAEDAARPFDLARGPLLRVTLVHAGGGEHALLVNMHHIVSDGWSLDVFFGELSALYEAFAQGRRSPLAELPVQYADFAMWQREWLSEEVLERQLGYWKERLAGAPPLLEIPVDRPRALGQSARGGTHPFTVSPEATQGLRALSRREGTTLFMTILSAWQALLGRYAGQEDVVVGTPIAGRTRAELEGLIGFFVNMLALRADLGGDPTWAELLRRTRAAALGAYAHQDAPFERLVDELSVERSLLHTSLFQVIFALNRAEDERLSLGEVQLEPFGGGEHVAKVDLSLRMVEPEEGLGAVILYRESLFEAATVARMAGHLEVLLEDLAAHPERRLSEVSLLRGAERAQLLHAWNGADTGYTGELCIHELVHAQVLRTPEAPALSFEGRTLGYAALYRGACRLARRLRREGVGPETRVGICMEPAPEMVVSVLGVLLAGGAYLPLDPELPAERRAYMLRDAAPALLLTQAGLAERLADTGVPLLCVDTEAGRIAQESDGAPETGVGPDNLAYVIYTSGSTGKPKGVLVAHRGVGNTLLELGRVYGVGPGDRNLLFAPLHFDSSVAEMFVALCNGAELVVTRREAVLPGEDLLRTLREERITHVKTMPSALAVTPVEPLPELRSIGTGGERLPAEVVRRWGAGRRFFSGYGATEASIRMAATAYTAEDGKDPPVGHPIPNTQLYVLDARLEPVPVGVAGELYIGGVGVVRGYLGRSDLTAERFVPDPHRGVAGARLYRTGDVGRRRADGEIEFLGRTDHQVKLRGYRVELGEIEAVLRAHAGVKEATVLLREDVPGQQRLVAYVSGEEGTEVAAAELRRHVGEQLPEYMVPGAFVVMERLPVTTNGKIDRRALPAPEYGGAEEAYMAPRTPAEAVLAGIWAEMLGVERVGVKESFFDLGGHSLLATRVVSRIRELLSVELPLRALFEAPTVAGLAERVQALRRAEQPVLPPVVPTERAGPLPLSFAQERLWFLDRLQPGSAFYNVPRSLRLTGVLDAGALERALGEIVRRHEALRTVFAEVEGSPVQVVAPFCGFALPVEDLSGLEEGERATVVERRATEDAARPFDLRAGPLFRAGLLRLGAEDHVLLLSMHHIVSDGWSRDVLFAELSALYGAYREGAESPLPELAVQYADYAVWQREQLEGEALERLLGFWREKLRGAPELLELPTDHPRPAAQSFRGANERVQLPPEVLERLRALGRQEGATLYMVALGAFQALLSRYSGSEDVVVGSPVAGRERSEVEELIGFFVNTLVLRTDVSGDPSFRELLGRVREVTLGAYEHQELPFERLVEELRPERSLSHSPLVQVAFTLDNDQDTGGGLAGLSVQGVGTEFGFAKYDLSLGLTAGSDGLRGGLSYSTDLWEAATMRRLVGHFTRLVEQAAADPDVRISQVTLLNEAERRQVVEEWNATEAEYPSRSCVHELFEVQVERTPGSVAVVLEDRSLTYAELSARANRLAHHLRALGIGPEARVGVLAGRSPELVVGLLAILKAGAAYVPIDPEYPPERIAYMLDDSGARLLLTTDALRARAKWLPLPTVSLSRGWSGDLPLPPLAAGLAPEQLAYVVYTSGSTGRPKGVAVTHGGLANLVAWHHAAFGTRAGERATLLAGVGFDASAWEVWPNLCAGATLHVVPDEVRAAPEVLRDWLAERAIETCFLPTPLAEALLPLAWPRGGAPRIVLTGGDRLHVPPGPRTPFTLVNNYGPTESTVVATSAVVPAQDGAAEAPSIGRPVANTRVYVLDASLEPVPVGVPGELYVGGVQVARGYLGQPGLTAQRFVPDPWGGEPGGRLYRTRDVMRWRGDGMLEFMGRNDHQVKVRGFRIELGEIEARLLAHPEVREATVLAREDAPGDKRLVAYYVGAEGAEAENLRAHLSERLPEYMVPAAFVRLEALPVTPNGKVDRRALPSPDGAPTRGRYAAPRTPGEEVLAGIWAEVLCLERVGVEESFFGLGGHSLLATRVMSRVRELFGVEVPLRALFEGPTVAELAGRVEEIRRAGAPALPPVVPTGRTGAPPLSLAQERLWFIDRLEPGSAVYNVPVARRLRGALDEVALERALGEIVRRHEALRTTFAEVDGSPVQVIAPFAAFDLPVEDLSGLGEAERDAAVRGRAREEARRAFDLSAGPLFRASLLRLGADDHVLLLSMHHIVSDGWSMGVLFRELSSLYQAYGEGGESPLPELAVQYADYAVWQREQLAGEVLRRQLSYWKERLAGAPELLELPTDHPRPAVRTYRGAAVPMDLSRELLERLQALGRSEGATLYMVLLSAFQVLLSRYGGGEDIVVGSPIAGRTRREVEALIGFFVNTLVLRTDLSGDPSFREVLGRVREVTLGAYEHQEVPFEKLVAELQPERSLSHSPLFQVMFTLQNAEGREGALAGLRVSGAGAELASAKFDLSLGLTATAQGLRGGLNYSTDLFEAGTIEGMARHLKRVLEQVARDADLRLSELSLAGEVERALLAAGHATRSFPVAERLDQRFEARARERPDAPALTVGAETLTYRELNGRANRLAHRLRALGVGPEVRVGIVLERSAELIVTILAVLKAGGAYVPLDPAYPADRIAFVLEDAGVPVLVTASHLVPRLPAFSGAALRIDADAEAIAAESGENPRVEAGPDTPAYVIYTSGSTGRPKGVQVTHANVARLFDATEAWFGFAADDVWTLFHSYAFDFSVWEIWGALLHGGRLVVVPYLTTRSPEDFHRLLADEGVTMLSQTPSAFKQLVQADLASGVDPSALRLRCVVFGGEALDPQSLRPWIERHGDRRPRLVNMYGITETTVHVTYRPITRADLDRAGSPIGVPIPDLALYVLDSRLEPVPPGVPGELFVGGAGVARGYLNRPELTAERFLRDPFSADPAARLYRSGDLARRRADGELEYLGRADQQVKIRGFRIEPGEIEAALLELPGMRDAAVLVRDEAHREKQLVAYVVLDPGEAEDPTALRAALSGRLPDYMVPPVFVVLPEMPLTANGKLDRRALPAPRAGRRLRPAYASPASAAERLLQEVWQEVLGAERVGVLENFFAAGGDSMRAVQVVAALRKRGMALTVRDLFEEPTIRGLAERTDAAARAGGAPEAGVPHHLADLPEEEWSHVRAVFPDPFQDVYPASRMQAVMLSEYAKDAARSGVYHPQQCHRLTDASLSTGALRHAIEQVVRRHAIFRTVFTTGSDGALLQVVRESPCVPIGYRDLRGLSPDEQERAFQARVAEDLDTPFDPFDSTGSLMRFVIFHREDHVADLLISAHHAIEDGWGNVHFVNTLFEAYADVRDGRPVSAAPMPNTYRDFVALEAEILASDEARTFWRDRMRQVSSPWPAPRGGTGGSPRECRVVGEAAPELTAALRETAAREGVALKALYLSSFLDVVAMLSGGEDACAGVVWNGRSERLSDPLTALGLFWNLVPVARPAAASGGAAERALAVHQDLLQADLFGRYPLAEIMADIGGREPFFSTFNFLHFRNWSGRDAVRGSRVEPVYGLDRLHLPFNLAVSLAPRGEGARLRVEYDDRFFSRVDVAAALESYLRRLEDLI